MYAIAPISSFGSPPAPIRSVSKHKRPQSQPRPASRIATVDDQQMLALGYHETQQGAPPVPLIPARSPLRSRSNSASASASAGLTAATPPPLLPSGPATLKKKQIRTLKTTAARPVPTAPAVPLVAPPRPPRPDDIDCLLESGDYPPPVPPIPTDLLSSVPRTKPVHRHGYSNSFGSSSNTSGSASISTPRESQDSVDFRHIPLSSYLSNAGHARSNSQKSTGSYPHAGEIPSMSVFEESSDEDESSYAYERGTSRKFRKGGLSLITRSSHKHPAPSTLTSGKALVDGDNHLRKVVTAPQHSPSSSVPGLSEGSESSNPPSAGERTPVDDSANKRFGRALGGKAAPAKPDHPDDELIALMQALKTPKRRESSARTRPPRERAAAESKSLSLLFQPSTVSKETSYTPITIGGFMIQ